MVVSFFFVENFPPILEATGIDPVTSRILDTITTTTNLKIIMNEFMLSERATICATPPIITNKFLTNEPDQI